MSSSPSGKFQDHYALFGIDPQADSDTIQAAYATLAEKYNPRNPETGDQDKFEAINIAFEVLSDPVLRASFDQLKGIDADRGDPKFSGEEFFTGLKQSALLRSALLCILYDRRRLKSFKPSLSMRDLEAMLAVTPEEMSFALWYLKQRGLVINDDKSSMAITVDGMDYLEQNPPSPEGVMSLMKEAPAKPEPAAKPTPVAAKPEPKPEPKQEPAPAPPATESLMNLLNRNRRSTDAPTPTASRESAAPSPSSSK